MCFQQLSRKYPNNLQNMCFFFVEKSVVVRSGVLACQTIKIVEFMIYMYHLNVYLY